MVPPSQTLKSEPLPKEINKYKSNLGSYLEESHVGAIVAVALVVVCVVDEGAVFLWDAITCGNTTQMFLF